MTRKGERTIRIRWNDTSDLEARVPGSWLRDSGWAEHRTILVKFGAWETACRVRASSGEALDELWLPKAVLGGVRLPEGLRLEARRAADRLEIGPVVGLLGSFRDRDMTDSALEQWLPYVGEYANIGGLIVAFSLEGMMDDGRKAIGCAFDPASGSWVRGVYPLPDALYLRRAKIGMQAHRRLYKLFGRRFFNAYAFSKWEMYCWLRESSVGRFLPETALLRDERGAEELFERYGKLFFKHATGSRGVGIYAAERREDGIALSTGAGGAWTTRTLPNWGETYRTLLAEVDASAYVAQQAVPLARMNDRVMDIRAVVQKDEAGEWRAQALIARLGPAGSRVSNVSRGGAAQHALTALEAYTGDRHAARRACDDIAQLALAAASETERRSGFHYGNFGMDIALDRFGALWLLEINNAYPDPTIALDANEPELFAAIMAAPLRYAKSLSGFASSSIP